MELTGKAKEDFEKWYLKSNDRGVADSAYLLYFFYSLTDSAIYGVYVDFFDSVGLKLGVYSTENSYSYILRPDGSIKVKDYPFWEGKNLSEARAKGVERANEAYNEQLK